MPVIQFLADCQYNEITYRAGQAYVITDHDHANRWLRRGMAVLVDPSPTALPDPRFPPPVAATAGAGEVDVGQATDPAPDPSDTVKITTNGGPAPGGRKR